MGAKHPDSLVLYVGPFLFYLIYISCRLKSSLQNCSRLRVHDNLLFMFSSPCSTPLQSSRRSRRRDTEPTNTQIQAGVTQYIALVACSLNNTMCIMYHISQLYIFWVTYENFRFSVFRQNLDFLWRSLTSSPKFSL